MADATGTYASQSDLEKYWDVFNIAIFSNKNGQQVASDGTPVSDTSAIQYCLDLTDDEINRAFDGSGYAVPLNPVDVIVKHWAVVIATYHLYAARGLRDEGAGNSLGKQYDNVKAEMAKYRSGTTFRLSASRRWPTPTAPTGV